MQVQSPRQGSSPSWPVLSDEQLSCIESSSFLDDVANEHILSITGGTDGKVIQNECAARDRAEKATPKSHFEEGVKDTITTNSDKIQPQLNAACPCCGQPATLLCTRCRSQKYCSPSCQKTHWLVGGHRKQCQSVEGQTVVVDVTADDSLEDSRCITSSGAAFALKVQVPLNSSVSPMIAYDQSRSVYYLINPSNCKKARSLDRMIRQTGDVMGSKAYFKAKVRNRDHKLVIYVE